MAGTKGWRKVYHDGDTDWFYFCSGTGNGESSSGRIPSVGRISAVAAPDMTFAIYTNPRIYNQIANEVYDGACVVIEKLEYAERF